MRWYLGILCAALALAGCETGQSKAMQGTAVGAALGTATGAVVGHHYQETGAGMAVGAGLGSVAGGLAGSALDGSHKPLPPLASSAAAPRLTKFCPIGGEFYPETFRFCPLHGAELRAKDTSGGTQ